MKRENLYVAAGALLASTALTTTADAGVFTLFKIYQGGVTLTSTTPLAVSAQIFGTTPEATRQIGPAVLAFRFNQSISAKFNAQINLTGARFNTTSTSQTTAEVRPFGLSSTAIQSVTGQAASLACSIAVATDKIILTDCSPSNTSAVSIGGVLISNVVFDNATGLATAGGTIAMDATISVGGVLFESTSSQAVVTSRNSYTATSTATTGVSNIDVAASPAFSKLANGGTSIVIASINVTPTGALGGDLSAALTGNTAHAGANIKITSAIFSDDATNAVRINGTTTDLARTITDFTGGSVTFTLDATQAQTDTWAVEVSFNGTSAIDVASAGTVDVVFTAIGASANVGTNTTAPPSLSGGATAGTSRNGLSIDINGIQPSVGQGARTYTSLLRIANTGSTAGTIAVRLVNEATGATLGTYTSPSIAAGASLQVSSATLETGAGVTPTASILYRATVTGSINGYVQHVNWNQDAGFFSDLSGRRQ